MMKESKKVYVIFGGSFNPPLNSHFSLAEQIINEYDNVKKVVFVPVNSLYKKADLIGNEHRYNMLKVVVDKNSKFMISRAEIDNSRPLYTIETLKIVQEEYKGHDIWFTIGTDNLKTLHTWEKAEELVSNFKILILERDQDDMEEIIQNNELLLKHKENFMKVKENVRSSLSSTFIRKKLVEGKSIRYFTPDEVYEYIKENNLFSK